MGLNSTFRSCAALLAVFAASFAPALAQGQKPNIVFIMGDDIGMWNIGAYHRGMMAGRTPNLDKMAKEGMIFTDYYAEASCTAGRANFITGQLPIRTGMTTVGQAGATTGLPAEACTIATALKAQGYATGQFGKNHLGDRNEFLPTVHGFDEFFGYLYHLDAMEDPAHPNYPQELLNNVGPRNMVHSWATDTDDPTEMPRWGKIGKQKIEDAGTLYPKRMETVDDEIRDLGLQVHRQGQGGRQAVLLWLNPTRMHIVTHLSPKWEAMRNSENGWSEQEAGMAQLDNDIGLVLQKLKDMGEDDNTIVVFTTDNGTEVFTWPDGGTTPFAQCKGRSWKAASACRASCAGPARSRRTRCRTASCPAWTGSRPSSPPLAIRPSREELLKRVKTRRPDLQEPSGWLQPDGHDHRQRPVRTVTRSSTSAKAPSARCASTTTSSASSTSPRAGSVKRPHLTCLTSPTCASIRSSAWAGPTTGPKKGRSNTSIGSSIQFWRFVFVQQVMVKKLPDLPRITRRCSEARASISTR